jgi:hypothetical protein
MYADNVVILKTKSLGNGLPATPDVVAQLCPHLSGPQREQLLALAVDTNFGQLLLIRLPNIGDGDPLEAAYYTGDYGEVPSILIQRHLPQLAYLGHGNEGCFVDEANGFEFDEEFDEAV